MQIKNFLLLFVLLIQISANSQTPIRNTKSNNITVEERIKGLVTIWSEVKFGFPYPDKLNNLNWEDLIVKYIPEVINAQTTESYYNTLMEFTTLLGDSHTKVIPPWGYFRENYDIPPLEIAVIEDKFYVSKISKTNELESEMIYPGVEILEVENIPVAKYFAEKILKYYTYGSKHANEATLVFYLLYGPVEEKVNLKIRDLKGIVRTVELSRKTAITGGSHFMYEFIANMMESDLTLKTFQDDILYVDIPTFENDNMGIHFKKIIDTLEIENYKGMIIDLRNNGGGSDKNSKQILQTLIEKPIGSTIMHYINHSSAEKAWGRQKNEWKTNKYTVYPNEGKRYLGKLVILINETTSSTAEDMAIQLQFANRATIIGRYSSGGAGNIYRFDLPGGGTFRMSTFMATYPDGSEYIGIGVKPDIIVPLKLKDKTEEKDVILERAIQFVEQQ